MCCIVFAGDKLYDRRKTAALEVEGLIKTLAAQVIPSQ